MVMRRSTSGRGGGQSQSQRPHVEGTDVRHHLGYHSVCAVGSTPTHDLTLAAGIRIPAAPAIPGVAPHPLEQGLQLDPLVGRELPVQADYAASRVALPADQTLALAQDAQGRFSFQVENA